MERRKKEKVMGGKGMKNDGKMEKEIRMGMEGPMKKGMSDAYKQRKKERRKGRRGKRRKRKE